jgi:MinD-like ATPase involved in chromosome partitioning or flagellar assembly
VLIVCGLHSADAEALGASAGETVTLVDDLSGVVAGLRAAPEATLLVLGPELPAAKVARFTTLARAACPDAVVVLLRPHVNRLERHAALQAGVDAVLRSGDLAAAGRDCRDLLAARAECGRGRIVTVFAAKGGCGKTTIAINLAVALADDPARRVALLDLDLHTGDVAATLGLTPEPAVHSWLTDDGDVAPPVTPLLPRLDCVLAPVRPGQAARLETEGIDGLLSALTRTYDVVVVDTPATFSRPVVSALDRSDHTVLVTTPERPALQSLRRTLDTIDLLGHRRDSRHVIFNRSDSGVGITAQDVERMLRTPIAAHVPSSRDVPASINTCTPLMVSSPDHPVSSAIRGFVLARLVSPAPASRPILGGAMT